MKQVHIVLVMDRHADPTMKAYTDPAMAVDVARSLAKKYDRFGEYREDPKLAEQAGWLFYATYSGEGDSVRVETVPVDVVG